MDLSILFDVLSNPTLGLSGALQAFGAFLLLCGFINAFFGYKLFKLLIAIAGFLSGALIGGLVSLGGDSAGLTLLCVLIGGIIGAVLAIVLHRLGVFLTVGATVFFLSWVIIGSMLIALLFGILCGIIGAIFEKYAIIISSALSGGALAGSGLACIFHLSGIIVTVLGLLIGICGIAFQLWLEQRRPAAAVPPPAAAPYPPVPPQPWPAAAPPKPAAPPAAVPTGAPVRQSSSYCPNCGSAIAPGSAFCKKCGRGIEAQSAEGGCFCAGCGAKMSGTANFCGKCGTARSV